MTETNAPCFTNPYDPAKRKIGSPGTAWGNEAKVIDPTTGKEQPRGTPGELMLRGDNVMTGLLQGSEKHRQNAGARRLAAQRRPRAIWTRTVLSLSPAASRN